MTRQWQPGDFRLWVDDKARRFTWREPHELTISTEPGPSAYNYRQLVVIDPEDREQVERLVACVYEVPFSGKVRIVEQWQAALREYANPTPPKARVYEHLISESRLDGTATSLCGKVWEPYGDVEVVGKCPSCLDLSERWVS